MIKNYEIRYKNNIEILYIYLDYNYEFGKLNGKKRNKKLKSEVKNYIKKNKIDFKGTTVAIMVGGLMVGTIMLNKPISRNINLNSNNSNNIVAILEDYNHGDELLQDEVIVADEVEVLDVNEKKEDITEKKENVQNVVNDKKIENVSGKTNNTKKENTSTQVSVVKVKESEEIKEEEIKKEELKKEQDSLENDNSNVDSGTYVNVYRSNGNVEKLELEEYILGVVGAEMPASFNKEALKAQAVVARTYALKCLNSGKKITDSSSTQNYKSINELKTMWGNNFNTYYEKVVNAVNNTKGEYLTYNGQYIDAVYHSNSNGKTEDSINVWGNTFPYLVSVDSIYDSTNKSFQVSTFYSYEDISNKLNRVITCDSLFNIVSRNESGRVNSIEIDGISFNGVDFRTLLSLRSTDFDIEKVNDGVTIVTRGYGHGVGMSQYGANGMSNNGYGYKEILLHYYRGVSINK